MTCRLPAGYLPPRRYRYPYRRRKPGSGTGVAVAIMVGAAVAASAGAKAATSPAHRHPASQPGQALTVAAPPPAGGTVALGQSLAAAGGWGGGSEWSCLYSLWERESGWSATADTRVTGAGGDGPGSPVFAYGIAQARPATKYPLAGQPPDLGGHADAATQIRWGLGYIQATYGDPCGAWGHETSNGWY